MGDLTYLLDVLILLITSIFIIVIMKKLRLSPVLGYLIGGALIGKYGLDLMHDYHYTENIAEFGVVFLMFVIGLDLTFERLVKMRWHVFGFGSMQLVITTVILTYVVRYFCNFSTTISGVVAAALSMSSTAIVMQILNEHKRQSTKVGYIALALLLMQDLAVVPLFIMLQILSSDVKDILPMIGIASVKAIVTIIGIIFIGRLFIRPFFAVIASLRDDGAYLTTSLLIVLGSAWITNKLGLSTAMGAFIAGLLVAETEYNHKVHDSITSLQSLFMALFFITVGMSTDFRFIVENFAKIFMFSCIFMIIKGAIITLLAKLFRLNWRQSINAGVLLSQISEFAFIMLNIAVKEDIISLKSSELLLMTVAFTMALTPLLAVLGIKIEDSGAFHEEKTPNKEFKGISDLNNHVIISGFGRVGRIVAYMLSQKQIDYVAVDSNAVLVKKARYQGFRVFHGDLSSLETLQSVGASRANTLILTMDDRSAVSKTTKIASEEFSNLQIIARVEDYKQAKGMMRLGANTAIPEKIEVGLQLGSAILLHMYCSGHDIAALKNKIRSNNYMAVWETKLFD